MGYGPCRRGAVGNGYRQGAGDPTASGDRSSGPARRGRPRAPGARFRDGPRDMTEVVTAGHGLFREIYSHPSAPHFETLLRAVPTRYPYDARRAEQLLQDAGFTRGSDGFWMTPTGQRFTLEQWYLTGTTNERDSQILVDGLRRFGIDATSNLWGLQRTSQEERAKTPGIFGGSVPLPRQIPQPRYLSARKTVDGRNRFGFANPELDRSVDGFLTALDRSARVQQLAQAERIAMEQLRRYPPTGPLCNRACLVVKGSCAETCARCGRATAHRAWEWQS